MRPLAAKKRARNTNAGFAVPSAGRQPLPGTTIDPMYPDEDGRPMGDTDFHSIALIGLRLALENFFAKLMDVYIATNLIFYYEQGNPKARRDPDVLVAKSVVGRHRRRSFRLWEEKVLPCTLFEIASKHTWRVDVGEKRDLYATIGVPEYFIFDPEDRYIDPALQGFRSSKGKSVPMKPAKDGSLISKQLGLRMVPEGSMLRLYDVTTGERILTPQEQAERQEAEIKTLRAENERLRRGKP